MTTYLATFLQYGPLLIGAILWAAVFLLRFPKLFSSSGGLARVAFMATCAGPILELLLNPRTQTAAGALSVYDPRVQVLSRVLTTIAVASSLGAISVGRSRIHGSRARLVLAVWALAGSQILAGFLALEQPGFPKDSVLFALTFHALVAGARSVDDVIRWSLPIFRTVTVISVLSIVVAPQWALIGSGDSGYDRMLFDLPRLTGLAPHSGTLADLSVVALLVEWNAHGSSPRARAVGLSSALICVVLTQSRTLWMAAVVAMLILQTSRHVLARVGVLAIVAGLATALVVQPAIVTDQLVATNRGDLATFSGRRYVWQLAWQEFQRQPITGYGTNFLNGVYRQANLAATEQQAIHAHNQVLQTLAESGLIGFLALVALFATLVRVSWHNRVVDRGFSLALLAVLAIDSITGVPLRPVGLAAIMPLVLLALVATASAAQPCRGLSRPQVRGNAPFERAG